MSGMRPGIIPRYDCVYSSFSFDSGGSSFNLLSHLLLSVSFLFSCIGWHTLSSYYYIGIWIHTHDALFPLTTTQRNGLLYTYIPHDLRISSLMPLTSSSFPHIPTSSSYCLLPTCPSTHRHDRFVSLFALRT